MSYGNSFRRDFGKHRIGHCHAALSPRPRQRQSGPSAIRQLPWVPVRCMLRSVAGVPAPPLTLMRPEVAEHERVAVSLDGRYRPIRRFHMNGKDGAEKRARTSIVLRASVAASMAAALWIEINLP